ENWAEKKVSLHFRDWRGLARTEQSLYGAGCIGDFVVNSNHRSASSRWAIILVGAAALALAGCGRKGPLELPPTASVPPNAAQANANADADRVASKPTV